MQRGNIKISVEFIISLYR